MAREGSAREGRGSVINLCLTGSNPRGTKSLILLDYTKQLTRFHLICLRDIYGSVKVYFYEKRFNTLRFNI